MSRRVAVTGLGVVSAAGIGQRELWSRLVAGTVCTTALDRFDGSAYTSSRAGEVREPLPEPPAGLDVAGMQRTTRLALAAVQLALDDAALPASDVAERTGIFMGFVVANRPGLEAQVTAWCQGRTSELGLGSHAPEEICRVPARAFGFRGPVMALGDACAAGNTSIALGAESIAHGDADVMVCGGADELSPAMFMMFSQHAAMSPDVVRPFDVNRRGLILAEGAGVLVLEAEEHARARGAYVYGYVAGAGMSAETHDMTQPHPEGRGTARAIRDALRTAGLDASDVDYVCAHGTGTKANDASEARAIRTTFGAAADHVPVSSLKSMLGHAQGAAAAIEAVACMLALRDGVIPPTANLQSLDPACEVDVVAGEARTQKLGAVLNNAAGFGGNVCCLALTRG